MNAMERSGVSEPIQGFRVDAHVNLTDSPYTYTPGPLDTAFRIGAQRDYYLGTASSVLVTLPPGTTTIVNHELTYTFDIATVVEVMR